MSLELRIKQLETDLLNVKRFSGQLKSSSGGGAGSIVQLDMPVRTVYSDYHIARHDYYIGVDHQIPVTITLPVGFPGRVIVVKDESGFSGSVPITINGTIDGDSTGVILNINHGGIQFLYNNGWRRI